MATIGDLLGEARERSYDFMRALETVQQSRGAMGVVGVAQARYSDERRSREAQVLEGWRRVAKAAHGALSSLSRAESVDPEIDGTLRTRLRLAAAPGVGEPDADLRRIGECLGAAGDIASGFTTPGEQERVRDEILSVVAHTARACSASLPRRLDTEMLDGVAEQAARSRSVVSAGEGTVSFRGVPASSGLEQAVDQWRRSAREWFEGPRVAESTATVRELSRGAVHISAAGQRAALAQGPDGRESADQWKDLAGAWIAAGRAFHGKTPMIGGDPHRPDPVAEAVTRRVIEEISGEFRDQRQRWVPVDRLAAPDDLARFERAARETMKELGPAYREAVAAVAQSEVLAIPTPAQVKEQAAIEQIEALPPAVADATLRARAAGQQPWIPLPASEPAAQRLLEAARDVGGAAERLPMSGESRIDTVNRSVGAAFPNRGSAPVRPPAQASSRPVSRTLKGPTLER